MVSSRCQLCGARDVEVMPLCWRDCRPVTVCADDEACWERLQPVGARAEQVLDAIRDVLGEPRGAQC